MLCPVSGRTPARARLLQRLLTIAVLLVSWTLIPAITDRVAHAQSTTPATPSATSVVLPPAGFFIRREKERRSSEFPFWLNRDDCLKDDPSRDEDNDKETSATVIELTPNLRGFTTNMNLEVWVGTTANCTESVERRGGTNGRCWNVYSSAPVQSGTRIRIRPRMVIAGKDAANWDSLDTCDLASDRIAVTFYVMLLKGGTNGDIVGTSATWDKTTIDITPPPPPTDVVVNPGDGRLFPSWNVPVANDREDTLGFKFYCQEVGAAPAGQGGSPGTGSAGTAGQGGESTVGATCSGSTLTPGMRTESLGRFDCGSTSGRTSRSGQAIVEGKPLVNGRTYAIGITARDQVFNESPLSDVICATPEEVTTFFEAYNDSGGVGGGGFCGYAPGSRSWGAIFLATLSVALAVWRRRRLPV